MRVDETHARFERVSRVAAERAAEVFETNEMLPRPVVDALGDADDAGIAARERVLHERLRGMVADLPQIQSIWGQDASGRPLLPSRFLPAPRQLGVSDREFFAWHREGRGGLHITDALVARMTGEVFSDLSLRRERPGGGFASLVSVGLYSDYFAGFHAELALELPRVTLSLLRADGRWISRHPGPLPLGRALPERLQSEAAQGRSGSIRIVARSPRSAGAGARCPRGAPSRTSTTMPRSDASASATKAAAHSR